MAVKPLDYWLAAGHAKWGRVVNSGGKLLSLLAFRLVTRRQTQIVGIGKV